MSTEIPSPATRKWVVGNTSDLFGAIHYSKNINLDEEGYVKLASRCVMLKTQTGLEIPVSIGRYISGTFYIAGTDDNQLVTLSASVMTSTIDAGSNYPGANTTTGAVWWQSRWYMSYDTNLRYKTISTGDWSTALLALTAGKDHPVEVFKNLNYLAVADAGNTVVLLDTSHSTVRTLTIPAEFEITNMKYNNNRLAITCRLASAARGANIDAFVFLWDGLTTAANVGIATGSDNVVSLEAYKSGWVMLTRSGQLRYFDGGGFTDLANLPHYYLPLIWGDLLNKLTYGSAMVVAGELILFNVPSQLNSFGKRNERYIQQFPGGVLCYDPKIAGFYHRYSPSISQAYAVTVASVDIDTATEIFTTSNTVVATGNPILYTSGNLTDILAGTLFFIIKLSSTTFKLATTKANALAGIAINITSAGSGNHRFHAYDLVDYGQTSSISARVGAIGLMGESFSFYDHVMFGGDYRATDLVTNSRATCYSVPQLENRGYIVTSKIPSRGAKDTDQKLFLEFKKLKDVDAILVKANHREYSGLPVASQSGILANFTSATVFTTTDDLSDAKTAFDANVELECEFTEGAGGGQMAKISALTVNAGMYTVTLADSIIGASNGLKTQFVIDAWEVFATITASDVDNDMGIKEITIGKESKYIKFKIEFRGYQTRIKSANLVNSVQDPSV